MTIEQEIAELKNRLDSLTAELNSQKLVNILELESPQTTTASFPVDNPSKLPMPSRKDEFEVSLGVALNSKYKQETIRRIQNNEPIFTKEEIQERKEKEQYFLLPFTPLEMIQQHGGKIINDLPSKFEGGKVNFIRGIVAQETNMLCQALAGLLEDGVIDRGGWEEVDELVEYIHDWNIRVCDKLLHHGYYPSSIGKSLTSPQNHDKAIDRLRTRSPEEIEKEKAKYKPQVKMPVTIRKPDSELSLEEFKERTYAECRTGWDDVRRAEEVLADFKANQFKNDVLAGPIIDALANLVSEPEGK